MNKKRILVVSLCAVLLCGILGASIAIVNAQGDSEPEASASESDSLQAECVESTDAGDDTPSDKETSASAPEAPDAETSVSAPEAPVVITLSHMKDVMGAEKGGENADLIQEALKLYAGQNVLYRIRGQVEWSNKSARDAFCRKNENGTLGELYRSPDYKIVPAVGFLPIFLGELSEEELRALLSCDDVWVALIDEFPEHLLPYNEPFDEPEVPAVVTRSHMVEKVGEDADLVAEALKLYAGQDTEYCIVVTAEGKAEFESFMEFAVELYRAQYHCEVWPGYSDDLIIGGWGDYLEDYQNGLYGTFYFDKDMKGWAWRYTDDAYWLSPLYAELPEAALRAVLECGGISVQLIDAFPEDVVKIDASVDT